LNKTYLIAKLNQFLLSYFTKSYIKKVIQKEAPSKIVIFHFFLVKPVLAALKELGVDIPVITVVTDPFTATRTWFMEKYMHYIVYSERIKFYAMSL
jgi:processive 1,2-diacylglycerol beta-glucosyltransferase/1,2-diacylglycerol 3-beta-galactosyltransferase